MSSKTEVLSFLPSWGDKPKDQKEQVIEEMLSLSMEKKRIPDHYPWTINKDWKLINPVTKRLIEEDILTNTPLYRKEYEALQKIQGWVKNKDSGFIVWISPPHEDEDYFVTKIVVSQIETTIDYYSKDVKRELINRAIVVETDSKGSVDLANEFVAFSLFEKNFDNTEDVRLNPIPLDNLTKDEWLTIAVHILKDHKVKKMIDSGEDIRIKNETRPSMETFYAQMIVYPNHIRQMEEEYFAQLFGQHRGTCTPAEMGAFDTFFSNSTELLEASFSCPRCNGKITSGLGITTCPHCKLTKEQAGNPCSQ